MPRILKPDSDGIRRAEIGKFIVECNPVDTNVVMLRADGFVLKITGIETSHKKKPPLFEYFYQGKTYPEAAQSPDFKVDVLLERLDSLTLVRKFVINPTKTLRMELKDVVKAQIELMKS